LGDELRHLQNEYAATARIKNKIQRRRLENRGGSSAALRSRPRHRKSKLDIAEHCIDDICAIDNQHKLKDAFLNEQGWVPVYYLFDAEGRLKTRAAGRIRHWRLKGALEKMFPEQAKAATA
jgi:hypothetical protein